MTNRNNKQQGGRKRNAARDRTALLESMFLRIFTEIAMARFKWTDLPDSVDPRYMELHLYYSALCVFYDDKDFGMLALKGSGQGLINHYDDPTSFQVIAGNGRVNRTLKATDCVPIWANALRRPDHDISMIYATKLAELERTIEINLMTMRHPFILLADDNDKLSIMNAMNQVREGQPVIVGTQALGDMLENKAKILDMKLDKDQVINLQLVKAKQWNDCMTYLGINNANQDKRERLVTSEVSANNSQVLMARETALNARRLAVERINKKYDLHIKVEWNVDVDTIAAEKSLAADVMES